jgi:hypothetical protein
VVQPAKARRLLLELRGWPAAAVADVCDACPPDRPAVRAVRLRERLSMRGGLAATGSRGGLAAKDEQDIALPIEAFRTNSPTGAVSNMAGSNGLKTDPGTQFYVAGYKQNFYDAASTPQLRNCASNAFQKATTAAPPNEGLSNWIYCLPEYFPRGCTITRLAQKINILGTQHVDNVFRLGVYDDAGIGVHFPKNLQADSGLIAFGTGASTAGVRVVDVNVSVRAGSLMWFVMTAHGQANSSVPNALGMKPQCCYPLLGCTLNTTAGNAWMYEGNTDDFGGWGIGWRIPRTFAALPTAMPETGAVRLNLNQADGNTDRVPAIFYTISGQT